MESTRRSGLTIDFAFIGKSHARSDEGDEDAWRGRCTARLGSQVLQDRRGLANALARRGARGALQLGLRAPAAQLQAERRRPTRLLRGPAPAAPCQACPTRQVEKAEPYCDQPPPEPERPRKHPLEGRELQGVSYQVES
jgi:hypothetical protein